MPQQQGTTTKILVAPEIVWGTIPTLTNSNQSLVIPFVSEGVSYSRTSVDDPTITAARENKKPGRGEVSVDGDIAVRLNTTTHPWMLMQVMGDYNVGEFGTITFTADVSGTVSVGDILTDTGSSNPSWARVVSVSTTVVRVQGCDDGGGATPGFINDSATVCNIDDITTPVGTVAAAGGFAETNATVASHRFRIGALPIGFSMQKLFPDVDDDTYSVFTYSGCRMNTFAMTLNASGLIEATFGLMARNEQISAWTSGDPVRWTELTGGIPMGEGTNRVPHVALDAFDILAFTEGTLRGSESNLVNAASVTTMSLNLDNNIDGGVRAVGTQGLRGSLPAGKAGISGSATLLFKDADFLNLALADTTTDLILVFRKKGANWDPGTPINDNYTGLEGDEQVTLVLPEVSFTPTSPAIDGPQGLTFSVDFNGFYDSASEGTGMLAIIENLIPDYNAISGMSTTY